MGQYYNIINLTKMEYLDPHDVNSGAKLMEFGYFTTRPILYLCELLRTYWHHNYVVICGDYYFEEIPEIFRSKFKQNYESNDLYGMSFEECKKVELEPFPELDEKIEDGYEGVKRLCLKFYGRNRFLINYDKKLYVDLYEYYRMKTEGINDERVLQIESPVAMLLALGNGIGSGDYIGSYIHLIGSWAYDNIGISSKLYIGLNELEVDFRYMNIK